MRDSLVSLPIYLVLRGKRTYRTYPVSALQLVSATKGKPAVPANCIAVKVILKVPSAIFDEFTPEATVVVPADLISGPTEVVATVGDARSENDA